MKTTKEFNQIYKRSQTVHTSQFVLFYHRSSQEYKVGIVASKKVGNAVHRNRAKRLLRAHFLSHIDQLKSGYYILVAKPALLNTQYSEVTQTFFNALKRLKALRQ